jgi:heme-degrading monooxygenase HmoA
MLIEHALLSVKPDQQQEFEKVFTEAQQVIAKAPGFQFVDLLREDKATGTYLLIVAWATGQAAVSEFRASDLYEQWRALLDPHFAKASESAYFDLLSHFPS